MKFLINTTLVLILACACRQQLTIPQPQNQTTATEVFSTPGLAVSAIAGIYSNMINGTFSLSAGAATIYCGMSADEFVSFDQNFDDEYVQFQKNILTAQNGIVSSNMWTPAYATIYQTNSAIEGLTQSTSITDSLRSILSGEAKFIRAFQYFYLTNLFGDIPLITSTNWNVTALKKRDASTLIFQQITQDLLDAYRTLPDDYSISNGERIRANKYAAATLLSKVSLYLNKYQDASNWADSVLQNTSLYQLDSIPDIFSANSTESILQLQQNNTQVPFQATPEGFQLIMFGTLPPFAYLTTSLLNAFESGDYRKTVWVNSSTYQDSVYYYPFKYTIGRGDVKPNADIPQYYMILRLADLYLIKAESLAQLNQLPQSASYLNSIRNRAHLNNTTAATKTQLIDAVLNERRIELFAEWGNRWLDLKRTGQASTVLSPMKSNWTNNATLYPIPTYELTSDPNLTQNPGY